MLASGRPVIATAHTGTQIATVVEGRGLVVPPEDSEALREAVQRLVDDPDLRSRFGIAARQYAELHLGKQTVLQQFEHDLLELAAQHR